MKMKKCNPKCNPCFKKHQARILLLVESRSFNIITVILILLNAVFLSLNYYDCPAILTSIIDIGNKTFTCIFAVEMVLKLLGLGVKKYVMDGFNDFDAIIVIIGLLEFLNVSSKAIMVLRCFRLLRIFKIVRAWKSLRKLLYTVLASLSSIANLGLLMMLLIFIYALIGMQFLSGDVPEYYGAPTRFNFNTFT
jgi:voltage-dependent calcium channel L type alpha-1D